MPTAGLAAVALVASTATGVPVGSAPADARQAPGLTLVAADLTGGSPDESQSSDAARTGTAVPAAPSAGSATAAENAPDEASPEAARSAFERAATRLGRAATVSAAQAARIARPATAAASPQLTARRWVPAMTGVTQTSPFGPRWGRLHAGLDFSAPVGSPVRSMSSGTVTFAGVAGGYGNKVEITYWDGTVSFYGHLSVIKVAEGDAVTPGQLVALSGNTGRSTGPHLHLEIHPGGKDPVDPAPWLRARAAVPR